MAIFSYIPLIFLVIAFMDYKVSIPLFENQSVGLKHFKAFLTDDRFWRSVVNTLGISALKITIGFVVPIIFALLLNEVKNPKFKKVVQSLSYMPHFISWAIFGGIMLNWMSSTGLINQIMLSLGLQSRSILYNADPDNFWTISGIDPGLYESAELDGANRWQKMWYITLQCIRPTISILFILAVSGCLGSNFDQIFMMTNSANISRSETIDLYIYNMGLGMGRYSFSTAVLFFRSIIAFALLQLCNLVAVKLTGESII